MPECHAVSWGQGLAFNSPDGYWLDASSMESQSDAECWNFEISQSDPPLGCFAHPLLHHWYASDSSCLMVNSKVSHDRSNWRFIFSEDVFQCTVGVFVSGKKGCLFGTDLETKCGEPMAQVPIGVNRLLCNLLRAAACCVEASCRPPSLRGGCAYYVVHARVQVLVSTQLWLGVLLVGIQLGRPCPHGRKVSFPAPPRWLLGQCRPA